MRLPACLSLLLALLSVMPLAGQPDKGDDLVKDLVTPYFPLKLGNKWTYQAGKDQQVVVEVEARKPVSLEIKDSSSGKMVKHKIGTYVLKMTSGDKTMTEQVGVLAKGSYRLHSGGKEMELPAGVYRFQSAGKELSPPECFLKLPLTKDESWDVHSDSEGVTIKGSFVGGEANVKVPAGGFQAMTVTSKNMQIGTQPIEIEYYFAPNLGIVKERVKIGTSTSDLELQKFEAGK